MRTDWEYRREESSLWEFIMPLIFSWSIEFVLEALEVCGGFWTGEDGGVWKLSDEVDDEDDEEKKTSVWEAVVKGKSYLRILYSCIMIISRYFPFIGI